METPQRVSINSRAVFGSCSGLEPEELRSQNEEDSGSLKRNTTGYRSIRHGHIGRRMTNSFSWFESTRQPLVVSFAIVLLR